MDRARDLIALVRQLVLFLLAVALIVDAITATTQQVWQIVAGLVLLGLVPVDALAERWARRDRP